jgi:hypothetical protein
LNFLEEIIDRSQLFDLGMQFANRVLVDRRSLAASLKDSGGISQKLPFPLMDHRRVPHRWSPVLTRCVL